MKKGDFKPQANPVKNDQISVSTVNSLSPV